MLRLFQVSFRELNLFKSTLERKRSNESISATWAVQLTWVTFNLCYYQAETTTALQTPLAPMLIIFGSLCLTNITSNNIPRQDKFTLMCWVEYVAVFFKSLHRS